MLETPNDNLTLPSSSSSVSSASSSDDVQPSDCLVPFLLQHAPFLKPVCSAFAEWSLSPLYSSKSPCTGDGEPKRLGYLYEK